MAEFTPYLTYSDYVELGGNVPEAAFPKLEREAQRKLDYYTHNRLKKLTKIPDEVKEVLTMYVDGFNDYNTRRDRGNISSYSNGTETFSYGGQGETEATRKSSFNKNLFRIAVEYLPIELISQVMNYDA